MKVRIVIDSTVDVPEQIKDRFTVVPLSVLFGEEEYVDGITITRREFYQKLVSSPVIPTTSQPTPDAFSAVFRKAVEAGEKVVAITISQRLSGTYQSASIAAMDFPGQVYVVDSSSVTIGAGVLAELALKLADTGMEVEELVKRLEQEKERIWIVAVLDTLEYLKRGGRISKAAAFAGGMLNIKPVIELRDGEINVLGKARGNKQGNSMLVNQVTRAGGIDFSKPVLLGYVGLDLEPFNRFLEDSKELFGESCPDTALIGSVVGTHVGPGGVAVAFFRQ